jgi:hypothetical protein
VHNIATTTRIDLATTVDDLGVIKAEIADLKIRERRLIEALTAQTPGAFEGRAFRATVSVSDRAVVTRDNFIAALQAAGVDPEVIVAAEFAATTVSPSTTVRVTARKS